ncbi:succinylglutamate desuccinylase/aspartoacylase family protein [Candidatus Dojkabacteria bacterium]|uniref:Succinylglutamate desuccinylase/aspartoacylase family protein n=1 Tax=Candidatus Dojkabacteria bacterium TaxID=2099670 RepID=A0A955KWI6_9BACT|nr:succinylglutamate desuccinylase/aspartoacylase family protein [Candidatus Dojkabacteria bacterium]MCB9790613.1 succinylglutamate desuccinylase/aspartoacylase family protein [Candidatus Nomurabacteria bacterium]
MLELKYCEIKDNKYFSSIPYFEIWGTLDGPSIFISAGVHGDEINGVYLIKKFIDWAKESKLEGRLKGRLFVLPILNLSGFRSRKRYVLEDKKDLNRQFGKTDSKTISALIASNLVDEIFSKCDMGVDIHDAGFGAVLLPHARIHISDRDNCISCSRTLAQIFGTEFILERKGVPSMMAVYMNNIMNKPVITVEIGGAGHLNEQLVSIGLRGLKNVLFANHMLDGEIDLPQLQYILHSRKTMRVNYTAVIKFNRKLGDWVEEGQQIGTLYCPETTKEEPLLAHKSGILFSIWPDNQICKGRQICSIVNTKSKNMTSEGLQKMENYQKNM